METQSESLQSALLHIKRKQKSALKSSILTILVIGVIGVSLLGYSIFQVNKRLRQMAVLDRQIAEKTQQLHQLEEGLNAKNRAIYELFHGQKTNISGRWRDSDDGFLYDINQTGSNVAISGIGPYGTVLVGDGTIDGKYVKLTVQASRITDKVVLNVTLKVSDDGSQLTGTSVYGKNSSPVTLSRQP
jgi:hypothetical protein